MSATVATGAKLLPTLFLSHGGGPCFFVDWPASSPFSALGPNSAIANNFRQLTSTLPWWPSVKALLVVSAHWEEGKPTVMTGERPPLLYDYSGFPPETYELKWDAPGAPAVAQRVQSLLEGAGIPVGTNAKRGFDHGVFVPLKLMVPDASIPTLQLSLQSSLDPELHLRLGAALAPLRAEGVLIIGSGFATHNLGQFFSSEETPSWATSFRGWLSDTMLRSTPMERVRRLAGTAGKAPSVPHFRKAHPREEHFTPLLVCVGAATPEAVAQGLDGESAAAVAPDGAMAAAPPGNGNGTKELYSALVMGSALMAHYQME